MGNTIQGRAAAVYTAAVVSLNAATTWFDYRVCSPLEFAAFVVGRCGCSQSCRDYCKCCCLARLHMLGHTCIQHKHMHCFSVELLLADFRSKLLPFLLHLRVGDRAEAEG